MFSMWLFYCLSGLSLIAAGHAVVREVHRPHALLVCALAIAGICVQLMAGGVAAVLAILAVVGSFGLWRAVTRYPGMRTPGGKHPSRRAHGPLLASCVALLWLAFVVIGTLARQYVWTGKRMSVESDFGRFDLLAHALGTQWPLALLGAVFAVFVAGVAARGFARTTG